MYLNHSGTHLIYDNTITHLQGDGLRLNDSNSNQNLSYNTITLCRNGILSLYSDSNRYYHNTLTTNTHNGLFLNDSLTSNTIRYNNCSANNHSGIYLNDFTNWTTIRDNTITSNRDTGIALENCSQATITANTITKNTNCGAKIIGSYNTLKQNTIQRNGKDGIYLSADDNNTIQNNTITANHNAGLRLYNSTADWITANNIADNTQFGAYLDFFTIQNVVYNNYFHGNTINAQDKSLNQNHWNITITPGTNIIGGHNISGNYYDTYDEISEGATDANGDGIADNPYTIYADNKDYGALLDTIPPTIGTIQITPTTQTLGGYTTITVQVTDNTQVNAVVLNIKGPSLHYTLPITQNKTGTTYTCKRQYLTVGNYTANITATDPRNTRRSTYATFAIAPGTPPTLKDQSPKNASPNTLFTFTANVTSTSAGAADLLVRADWTHASREGNLTLTHTTGNTFTGTILLDHSTRNLTYHYYACDTWGNALLTTTTTVPVIDHQKPRIIVTRYGLSYANSPAATPSKPTSPTTQHSRTSPSNTGPSTNHTASSPWTTTGPTPTKKSSSPRERPTASTASSTPPTKPETTTTPKHRSRNQAAPTAPSRTKHSPSTPPPASTSTETSPPTTGRSATVPQPPEPSSSIPMTPTATTPSPSPSRTTKEATGPPPPRSPSDPSLSITSPSNNSPPSTHNTTSISPHHSPATTATATDKSTPSMTLTTSSLQSTTSHTTSPVPSAS